MNTTARYKQIQTETASRERLLVMLLDGALKNIHLGVAALEENRAKDATTTLTKASDIVVELHATLDRAMAPDLCDRLAEIYRFVSIRLVRAALSRDKVAALEAERALVPIAEAFREAVATIAATAGVSP
jgi:flagellar protein FliS